uniref:Lactadherin-like n=1 Tax=Phallusia mammillata TaxID=59560 RepID=A0A6F9DK13_9ASCI|nr:lactadherin-like [Phallusia mammillata]
MLKEVIVLLAVIVLCSGCRSASKCCDRNDSGKVSTENKEFSKINIQANRDSLCKLGLKTHYIPDSAITASSYFRSDVEEAYSQKWGRLDQAYVPHVSVGSWAAATNNVNEWIQVTLENATTITGVITQGRANLKEWVREFKVSYFDSDHTWKNVNDSSGTTKLFSGNWDQKSPVTNMFHQPIVAHKLRIYPTKFNNHISLRHEYLTC